MREYVFRRSRVVNGKRVLAPYWSGGYTLAAGEKVVRISLHTPSQTVAKKMLRGIIERKQMEREGIVAPDAIRSAASASLASLVGEYEADLKGRGLVASHIKETVSRIRRVISGAKWSRLGDISSASFVAWRAVFVGSAKTKKEYQTSIKAFLNWLVRFDRLTVNPLAKIDRVETRGKAVRQSRAYTPAELLALFKVSPENRRTLYLFLVSTGLRKREARNLRWECVDLVKGVVSILGKGGRSRVVPLRPELVELLRVLADAYGTRCAEIGVVSDASALVFTPFPSDDALHADLKCAGIERKNGSGRVVHWHAFRKTFATTAAASGVGQRIVQAVLGHSTPTLSANVYTDVEALPLRAEVSRLPWLGALSPEAAPVGVKAGANLRFRGLLAELLEISKSVIPEEKATLSEKPHWLPDMDSNHD